MWCVSIGAGGTGIHGVAVRPVVFVVMASVPLVLNESAAKGECMVVPGRVAWVVKECVVSPPAAADTRAHGCPLLNGCG